MPAAIAIRVDPAERTRALHNEQERHGDVRFVHARADAEKQHRGRDERQKPNRARTPRRVAERRHAHVTGSNRYPTPGSVMMSRGRTGSLSILRRRLRMWTRRYC